MKNIIKPIIALFALFAVSCSVEDVQDRPVISAGSAPVLTAPTAGAIYELLPANASKQADRFTWTSANYGGSVEVTYAVQVDLKGAKFAHVQTVGSVVSQNQLSVSQLQLNTAALALGATPYAPTEMEVRIQSTLGTAQPLYSNVIGIVVTPYTTEAPKLYVPGGYANASGYGSDWSPATSPKLAASGYGKVDFEGYVYFAGSGEYKLTAKANWDGPNYGAGAAAGSLDANGGNLKMNAAGYYKINANTTTLAYTAVATSWGIIGDGTAQGWNASTPMTYNPTTKVWTVTATLTANSFKFRANDGWDINFGDDGANGSLEYGGANISIPSAGSYTITLDLSSPRDYKFTLKKN